MSYARSPRLVVSTTIGTMSSGLTGLMRISLDQPTGSAGGYAGFSCGISAYRPEDVYFLVIRGIRLRFPRGTGLRLILGAFWGTFS